MCRHCPEILCVAMTMLGDTHIPSSPVPQMEGPRNCGTAAPYNQAVTRVKMRQDMANIQSVLILLFP